MTEQAAGEHRVRLSELFDAEIRRHNERFRVATGVGLHDRVLDIGCGMGQSTREAARAAVEGCALGVDVSAPALEVARRLSAEQGLRNVSYEQADAQVHPFPPAYFDLCISRFGAMFFADPPAAFTNIGASMRRGGRLVLLVWQTHDNNEWSTEARRALEGTAGGASPASWEHPFSLGDPAIAGAILGAAGFADVAFTEVHEPVYYGPDTATAYDLVLGLRSTQDTLAGLDDATAKATLGRLRATIAAHETSDGVFFDSRAWIITAHRH